MSGPGLRFGKTAAYVALALCAAPPGSAGAQPVDPRGLISASPATAAVFEPAPDGVRHKLSGAVCPIAHEGATLTRLGASSPTGIERDGSYCEYSQSSRRVGLLTFSPAAPDAAPLTDGFCRDLPGRLGVSTGLPWSHRYSAPERASADLTRQIGLADREVWMCGWRRAPDNPGGLVILDVTAVRRAEWVLRAMYLPPSKSSLFSPGGRIALISPSEVFWTERLIAQATGPALTPESR